MIERMTAAVSASKGARLGALALILLFGAIAFESRAHADQILADADVFVGDSAAQYSLNVSGPGSMTLYLKDFDWPSPIADLTLEIASQGKILGEMKGAGTETLSLSGPGTYYAYVVGNATGSSDVGAYGLIADFQVQPQTPPVPLPGSFSLLLGGLAAMVWYARRKGRTENATA